MSERTVCASVCSRLQALKLATGAGVLVVVSLKRLSLTCTGETLDMEVGLLHSDHLSLAHFATSLAADWA